MAMIILFYTFHKTFVYFFTKKHKNNKIFNENSDAFKST